MRRRSQPSKRSVERRHRLRPAAAIAKQAEMMRNMLAILKRVDGMPILDDRSEDDILGYGESGLPD